MLGKHLKVENIRRDPKYLLQIDICIIFLYSFTSGHFVITISSTFISFPVPLGHDIKHFELEFSVSFSRSVSSLWIH